MSRRGQSGLTLVELMIAVVISGLVISAALAMGFSMMNGYRDHRAMVLVERSARVSLEIMADAVRNSSPGVPAGQFADVVGCTGTAVAGLEVTNNSDKPDELKVIYATGGLFSSVYQDPGFLQTDTTFTVLDAPPERGGLDGQDFYPDDDVVITNLDAAAIVPVLDVAAVGDKYQLTVTQPQSCGVPWPVGGFAASSLVIRARYVRFFIEDGADVGGVPTLMMDPDVNGDEDPEPIAEGVEDMQIAIAFDRDGDGSISEVGDDPDDDEWFYNVADDPDPEAGVTIPADAVPRAIRITLIARSTLEQSEVDSYERPAAEDHAADSVKDPYRRRVLSTTVEIRNLNGSP